MNSDLHPANFDATLTNVLGSTAEMEKIQELNEQEFQSVVEVLSRVRIIFVSLSLRFLMPYPPVLGNRGCYKRAWEEMLQLTVQDLCRPRSLTKTVRAKTE